MTYERLMSRRDLLKATAVGAAGLLLTSCEVQDPVISNHTAIIDFIPNNISCFLNGITVPETCTVSKLSNPAYNAGSLAIAGVKGMLHDIRQGQGQRYTSTQGAFDRIQEYMLEAHDYPAQVLFELSRLMFQTHGLHMVQRRKALLSDCGKRIHGSYMLPLLPHIELVMENGSCAQYDTFENQFIEFGVNPQTLIGSIRTSATAQSIISFSFQLGKIGLKVVKKEQVGPGFIESYYPCRIEKMGAYQAEKARNSFHDLLQVISSFPDKIFVCALGNNGDDPSEVIQDLISAHDYPPNLILAGQVHEQNGGYMPSYGSYAPPGQCIMVNNPRIGYGRGSSSATIAIDAIFEMMLANGVPREDLRDHLFSRIPVTQDIRGRPIRLIPDRRMIHSLCATK